MYNNTLFSIGLSTLELKGMDNDILCKYVKENIGKQNRHVNSDDVELAELNAIVLQETHNNMHGYCFRRCWFKTNWATSFSACTCANEISPTAN